MQPPAVISQRCPHEASEIIFWQENDLSHRFVICFARSTGSCIGKEPMDAEYAKARKGRKVFQFCVCDISATGYRILGHGHFRDDSEYSPVGLRENFS
jgi:hypothetical protein